MVAPLDQLLWDIVRCPRIDDAFRGLGDCSTVVQAQRLARDRWHVPEPWNGALDTAPILFISSNPSFDATSTYPTAAWRDEYTAAYFTHRFVGYVYDDRALLDDNRYSSRVQYWTEARTCTAQLLNVQRADVRPGIDYALTEVVHCKSRKNAGTASAATACADRFLRRIVERAGAHVVVCYGDNVWPHTRRLFGVPHDEIDLSRGVVSDPVVLGGRERIFVFLAQPSSSNPRKPSVAIRAELPALREFLRERA